MVNSNNNESQKYKEDGVELSVGDVVTVQGTGNRWAGVNYQATIVDVRDSDGTVKIRYTDGGYKRIPKSTFRELLVREKERVQAYEFNEDSYDPTVEAIELVGDLKKKLHDAVSSKNFQQANSIKIEINKIIHHAEKLKELNHNLSVAVQNEDFLTADKINKELNDLKKKPIALSAPKPLEGFNYGGVLSNALHRALSGGISGSIAMTLQVVTLMWLRTTMNYQYRYGKSMSQSFKILYAEGGVRRFYKGLLPALIQGPLSRFGDTAANTGVLEFFSEHPQLQELPVGVKTATASIMAGSFRIFLMPVDTIKTTLQVEGAKGLPILLAKARKAGPQVFYYGALASATATFAGHFPWFFTYNFLDSRLPKQQEKLKKLARNALMGFTSSVVSDTISNSIRVVKTYRQTAKDPISYLGTIKAIIHEDGYIGLFGRGLKTRILTNGMQGLMFSVLWKYFDSKLSSH
jgi:hypothetical protein